MKPKHIALLLAIILLVFIFLFISEFSSGFFSSDQQQLRVITDRYIISEQDSGSLFIYPLTTRFTVISPVPFADMRISCSPSDAIGRISNEPSIPSDLFTVRFEAVRAGTCAVSFGAATAYIRIQEAR